MKIPEQICGGCCEFLDGCNEGKPCGMQIRYNIIVNLYIFMIG